MENKEQFLREKNILVFPCGSEIGLEIHKALSYSTHVEVFGASSVSSNHGKYVYKNYIEKVPFVEDDEFIDKLNLLIDNHKIDFVFPAHDSVVLKLAESQNELHCKVIGSPVETCRICRSKKLTYETFISLLAVPKTYKRLDNDIEFPIFLKPSVGQGSKSTFIANSKEEVSFCLEQNNSLLLLEFLPGREYTIDCFTDRHGVLRFAGGRERLRISNGISVDTYPVFTDERFKKLADTINKTLKFRGAWFFQVKERSDGELVLLEIAPRIAGAMGLYRNCGINMPLLSVFDAQNMDVEIYYNNYLIEMDRALINRFTVKLDYQHVYIDLEDTVILNNRVNIWIIAFLYQCLNKGIKIHLISRHRGNIEETLQKYRLESIFDTVTNINQLEEKSDYIKESPAIFIDDSFSERKQIFEKKGIPTFDINSIECLLDWRV